MPNDTWELYTDGSANNTDRVGAWAWVLVRDGHLVDECWQAVSPITSNAAEMMAIWQGLRALPDGITELTVLSDSRVALGWVTVKTRCNLKAMRVLRDAANKEILKRHMRVTWKHVYGHAGNEWNHRADTRAYEAWRDYEEVSDC